MCDKLSDSEKGDLIDAEESSSAPWVENCSDSPGDSQWYVNVTNKCSTPVCVVFKDGGDNDTLIGHIQLAGTECQKLVHNFDSLKYVYYDNSGAALAPSTPVETDQTGCDSGQKSNCGRMKPVDLCSSGSSSDPDHPSKPKDKKWYESLLGFFYTKYGIITGVMIILVVFLLVIGLYLYMDKRTQMQSQQMLMAALSG